jgi:hypothetical protein
MHNITFYKFQFSHWYFSSVFSSCFPIIVLMCLQSRLSHVLYCLKKKLSYQSKELKGLIIGNRSMWSNHDYWDVINFVILTLIRTNMRFFFAAASVQWLLTCQILTEKAFMNSMCICFCSWVCNLHFWITTA